MSYKQGNLENKLQQQEQATQQKSSGSQKGNMSYKQGAQ